MSNIAAFFDIDGTLFRDSLLIEHFKLLIKNNYLSIDAWTTSVEENFIKWNIREGDYDTYIEDLVEYYLKGLVNIEPDVVYELAKRVVDEKEELYRFTRERLKQHIEAGHKIIIISGSPIFLIQEMAKKFDVKDYKGSIYLVENGKFTGQKVPMWDSISKNKAIDEFVKKYDLDLEKSYAYGDTTGDYSMLSRVGHPYAINPAKKLLNKIVSEEELRNKTKIIIERKDVIYTIDPNNIMYNKEDNNDTGK